MITRVFNFQIHVWLQMFLTCAFSTSQPFICSRDVTFASSVALTFKVRLNISTAIKTSLVKLNTPTAMHPTVEGALYKDDGSGWTHSIECLPNTCFLPSHCTKITKYYLGDSWQYII